MSLIERASIAVISLFGALLAALLTYYAVFPWRIGRPGYNIGERSGVSAVMSLLAMGCFFMVVQFIRGKRWAWWGALVLAAMTLGFGLFCLSCAFFPTNSWERAESGFLLLAGIVFAIPAGITGTLLNVPPVRRRYLD